MTKIRFFRIVLLLFISAVVLYLYYAVLQQKEYSDNPLVVDLLITPKELFKLGFSQSEVSTSIQKHNIDHLTQYDYLPSTGLVYTKYEIFFGLNKGDFKIDSWINDYGGILCSNWSTTTNGFMQAFVLHRETGQVSSVYLEGENVIVCFYFPDIGRSIRSKNRKFDENGDFVIIDTLRRINHKEIFTIRGGHGLRH